MRRLTVLSIALLLAGSEAAPAQESLCYRAQPKPAVRYRRWLWSTGVRGRRPGCAAAGHNQQPPPGLVGCRDSR